jgi:hypothetical protein
MSEYRPPIPFEQIKGILPPPINGKPSKTTSNDIDLSEFGPIPDHLKNADMTFTNQILHSLDGRNSFTQVPEHVSLIEEVLPYIDPANRSSWLYGVWGCYSLYRKSGWDKNVAENYALRFAAGEFYKGEITEPDFFDKPDTLKKIQEFEKRYSEGEQVCSYKKLIELATKAGWNEREYAKRVQPQQPQQPQLDVTDTSSFTSGVESTLFPDSEGYGEFNNLEPEPRDYLVHGLMVPAVAYVLAGLGGSFKTQLAIMLVLRICLGKKFSDRIVKEGAALLIMPEESLEEVDKRINAEIRANSLSEEEINKLRQRIRRHSPDQSLTLTFKNPTDGNRTETQVVNEIIIAVERHSKKAGCPVRLIVLDHASFFHGGDTNNREDAAATMAALKRIARETGASVLLIAHSPKSAVNAEASDASQILGSTAFVDMSRGVFVVSGMREAEVKELNVSENERKNFVSMTVVKNNYGPTYDRLWFRKAPQDDCAVLQNIDETHFGSGNGSVYEGITKEGKLDAIIKAFIRKQPGKFTVNKIKNDYSGKNGPFEASQKSVVQSLDRLIEDGELIQRSPTDDERKQYQHRKDRRVLDVSIEHTPPTTDHSAELDEFLGTTNKPKTSNTGSENEN